MKSMCKWPLLGMALATAMAVATPSARAEEAVALSVYNPTGAVEVTQTFTPRVADLNGKTICEVSDDQWEANRTFPLIKELLQKQFPTAKIVPPEQFPTLLMGSDVAGLEEAVKKAGCQAVIVGNAG